MKNPPKTAVLRYFDCWGRVQGIRDFLHDQGVSFEDERIAKIEATNGGWTQRQIDKAESLNSFQALPVLEWGEERVEQTEAISLFLTLESGMIEASDTRNLVQHASAISYAHQDLFLPMALFLWTPIFSPEKDLQAEAEQNAQLISRRGQAISKYIEKARGDFLFGSSPSIADCGLFNAALAAEQLFGRRFNIACSKVEEWKKRMHKRLSAHSSWAQRPTDISGSPVEDEIREKLPTLLEGY